MGVTTLGSSMPPHALLCPPLPCTLSLRWQRTYLVLFADLSAPWTQGQRNALDRRQEPEVSSDICWEAPPRAGKSLQMGSEQMLWTEMVRACGAWRERGWYPSPHWMMWWGTGKGQWSQTMALGLSHPTHRVAGWVLPMWQCVRKLRLTGTWGWDLQSRTCPANPSLPSASKAESSWLCQTAPRGQVGQGWGLLAAIFPGTACCPENCTSDQELTTVSNDIHWWLPGNPCFSGWLSSSPCIHENICIQDKIYACLLYILRSSSAESKWTNQKTPEPKCESDGKWEIGIGSFSNGNIIMFISLLIKEKEERLKPSLK